MNTNPYSHCRRGSRADIKGGTISFRSAWEANYARYLNWLTTKPKPALFGVGAVSWSGILSWSYETKEFQFPVRRGPASFYIPDFEVYTVAGVEYHEVKGYMNATSKAKLRRMRKYFPDVKVVLVDAKVYRGLQETVGALIPNWEGLPRKLYGKPAKDKK